MPITAGCSGRNAALNWIAELMVDGSLEFLIGRSVWALDVSPVEAR